MNWLPEQLCLERPGGRASLQTMRPMHVQELYQAGNDSEIWLYMPMKIDLLEDANLMVELALSAKQQGTEYPFVIFDRSTGSIVGSTRYLELSPAHRSLEIGWTWLSPQARRTSINTECKTMLLQYAFEKLGAERVQIKTDGRNERSQKAIERIGGKKEGVLRKHRILPDGFIRDTVYYSIVREEWPEVKARLELLLRN